MHAQVFVMDAELEAIPPAKHFFLEGAGGGWG